MNITLSVTQLDRWNQTGYIKIPGFLTAAETENLREWVDEISSWPADDEKWMHHFEQTPFGVRPARTEYILAFHSGIRQLLTQGKIPECAGELMGEPAILYKEKINYKYPGGGGYAAHQDAPAYEFIRNHITCSVAVDAATPENGCLFFAPELHQRGLLHLDKNGCIDAEYAETLDWEPIPMQPGDALFFSSYAPHKSPPNATEQSRRTLYLTYNAVTEGDLREEYYADKRRSFAQADPTSDEKLKISKIGHFDGKPA
ncbi:phytanoyl-CoA dioxygenase family protein [Gimesia sp.]|uniref:phytanoyl-CoA dioxygenase family protein n=1 Tax=Gimesia sp. TaxID=2024833 RepID=UPI000C48BA75|nr:phytanoyl-CoA dioxygenase family protein [Gimesia sp.]MAX36822.1 phytanoyl-CoA dioxygenase [Gimesia sp.]HAH46456.1 phytanoyl-CoA dioxygenase family protein [Planctomycetaceae bacterium]HBL46383.1 phytanoyl-CoA dioxygenase family protein [Planctomycetaceae bacterium]|tara:strand:+ start:754 stop:1527 length:774 start_codon:yes stop_codon:yes gene_type:complete